MKVAKPLILPIRSNFQVMIKILSLLVVFVSALCCFFFYVNNVAITGFYGAYMFLRYADNFLPGCEISWNRDGV